MKLWSVTEEVRRMNAEGGRKKREGRGRNSGRIVERN